MSIGRDNTFALIRSGGEAVYKVENSKILDKPLMLRSRNFLMTWDQK